MPYKELEAIQEYENLAIKCNDSVSYAIGVERKCNAYTLLHDTTNIIRYTKKASNLLYKLGRHSQSTFVLSTLIPIYIEKGEVTKAEHLIKIFEKDTNFFTINGDIIKGREFYYCAKAKYFEKTNRLDSAELYYRKLYKYGYQYDACCGLLDIYTELMCMDSVYKYSKLKDKASIMKYTELHTQAMFNADGMFNYTRNQRIAMGLQIEKEHIRTRALTIGSIGLCLMILGVMTLIRYKERKKREIEAISLKYRESKQIYKKAIVDYTLMEKDFEEYKAQKAKEIELLGELNRNASTTYEHTNRRHILTSLCSHDIVKQILKNENIGHNHRSEISVRQWNDLYNLFEKEVPQLYNTYINNHKLSDRERKTLVLTSLGINTNNIAILLNTTASNISNIKTCINQKLFSDSSAKKLYDNLILA
ncbi:MAG: hypothetical protein MJZ36_07825 [Bacteroidaceae bacterium]|nr:hypothetical protein [Bacteroidaceae bacterium]